MLLRETRDSFSISTISNRLPRRGFGFGNGVAGFLSQPDLPIAETLTEERIARVFTQHNGVFGRSSTTANV